MILIINKRTGYNMDEAIAGNARIFYVGRGSPLGNPFRIEKGQSREIAIAMYGPYIKQKLRDKDEAICSAFAKIVAALKADRLVALECYCAPLKCHAEKIAEIAMGMLEEEKCRRSSGKNG